MLLLLFALPPVLSLLAVCRKGCGLSCIWVLKMAEQKPHKYYSKQVEVIF
jgi:hypothetical protein